MKLQELIDFTYLYNSTKTVSTTIIELLRSNGLYNYYRMFTSLNWHGHILRRDIKKRLK